MRKASIYSINLLMVSMLSLSQVPYSVYAIENPLSDSQNKNTEELDRKFDEGDKASTAKSYQKIDIEENSYEMYSQSKQLFQKMQSQYGNLEEDNHSSDDFKSYLKVIQQEKKNLHFNSEINKIGEGDYSVSISDNTYTSLRTALTETLNEEKKRTIETEEKELDKSIDNSLKTDGEELFGDSYNRQAQEIKDNFEDRVQENNKKTKEETDSQIIEFGESKDKTNDNIAKENEDMKKSVEKNKQNILNQTQEQNKVNSQVAEAFKESGQKNGESITKNYNVLRNAILNIQKIMNTKRK